MFVVIIIVLACGIIAGWLAVDIQGSLQRLQVGLQPFYLLPVGSIVFSYAKNVLRMLMSWVIRLIAFFCFLNEKVHWM